MPTPHRMAFFLVTTQHDRDILRPLAARVREIADLPEMADRRQRWLDHNALRPQRPLILCFPEGAWRELLPDDALQCNDEQHRRFEWNLRHTLYWWDHLRDDAVIEPWFNVSWVWRRGGYGVDIPEVRAEQLGSYVWDPPIKDLDADFDKLVMEPHTVDRAESDRRLAMADEAFGDLLPVRRRDRLWWTMGLTHIAARLVGLEQLLLTMYDNPEGLHRLMAWLRDCNLNLLDWVEAEGLLSPHNENDYTGSGGLGYTDELASHAPARLSDLWGFAESQETVGVSPDMFEAFVLQYEIPLLERFGLNCYGCCEPIHDRLPMILRDVPRLRRVSGSPWVDQQRMRDLLGDRVIFSRKPNPTLICSMFNEDRIREDLRRTLAIAGRGPLEIIMKDTHTINHEPWRITRWVEIALEEVDRYMT